MHTAYFSIFFVVPRSPGLGLLYLSLATQVPAQYGMYEKTDGVSPRWCWRFIVVFARFLMTEKTPIDLAHAAMEAAPEDATLRLQFYENLAASELFLLVTEEVIGDTLSPEVFDVADSQFVLVFDREERLAQFAGRLVPFASLSGRVIASMLTGQGIGLGVNLDVASSSILIPASAVEWLADTLRSAPQPLEARMQEFTAPVGLPEILLKSLDAKLASATGLARAAYLVGVSYEHGNNGYLLGFVDAHPGAETALAQAANEALTFSGIEAGSIDVGFFDSNNPVVKPLAKCGLRFDLPDPVQGQTVTVSAPGMNRDAPPILR